MIARYALTEKLFNICDGAISKRDIFKSFFKVPEDIMKEILADDRYQPSITIITDSRTAAQKLCLSNTGFQNVDFDNAGDVSTGQILFGNATLGENYHYQNFYNGNLTNETKKKTEPQFEITKPLMVLVDRHRWHETESYRSTDIEFNYHINSILLYLPAKEKKPARA